MKTLKEKIRELADNQNHIVEAIKHLKEQFKTIIEKNNDEETKNVKNIIESQTMIDELVVKNSDDIALMKKVKDDNAVAIKHLESKIHDIEKEIDERMKKVDKSSETGEITCKYYNRGFCKKREFCVYLHKSATICESRRNGTKCENNRCEQRHPRTCKHYLRSACWRDESCAYLHLKIQSERVYENVGNVNHENVDIMNKGVFDLQENMEEAFIVNDDEAVEDNEAEICQKCECKEQAKLNLLECGKCRKYFCIDCSMYPLEGQENCLQCMSDDILNSE